MQWRDSKLIAEGDKETEMTRERRTSCTSFLYVTMLFFISFFRGSPDAL